MFYNQYTFKSCIFQDDWTKANTHARTDTLCIHFLTLKNIVFWDVAPCGSGLNQRFRGNLFLIFMNELESKAFILIFSYLCIFSCSQVCCFQSRHLSSHFSGVQTLHIVSPSWSHAFVSEFACGSERNWMHVFSVFCRTANPNFRTEVHVTKPSGHARCGRNAVTLEINS
jgi:hypothetical protein